MPYKWVSLAGVLCVILPAPGPSSSPRSCTNQQRCMGEFPWVDPGRRLHNTQIQTEEGRVATKVFVKSCGQYKVGTAFLGRGAEK